MLGLTPHRDETPLLMNCSLGRRTGPSFPGGRGLRSSPQGRKFTILRRSGRATSQGRHRLPYSPLGRGFLTGKMNENTTFESSDFRNRLPRFTPEARKANQALVHLLSEIAKRKKATPAQVALAWLRAQKPWIVPIPGTTKLNRLEANLGAANVELTPDDLHDIDDAVSKIAVEGA